MAKKREKFCTLDRYVYRTHRFKLDRHDFVHRNRQEIIPKIIPLFPSYKHTCTLYVFHCHDLQHVLYTSFPSLSLTYSRSFSQVRKKINEEAISGCSKCTFLFLCGFIKDLSFNITLILSAFVHFMLINTDQSKFSFRKSFFQGVIYFFTIFSTFSTYFTDTSD